MLKNTLDTESYEELRKQAETILKTDRIPDSMDVLSHEEISKIFHELKVHQIELSIQNEELRRTQVELEAVKDRYFDLYDLAPVGYCTISEKGLILEANLTATNLLGVTKKDLTKQPIARFILKDDQNIYYLHRKQLLETGVPQVFEVRLKKKDETIFWARLEATSASSNDENVCRVVISDITEKKKTETVLVEKLKEIDILYNCTRLIPEERNFANIVKHLFKSCENLIGSRSGYVALLSKDTKTNEIIYIDSQELHCNITPGLKMPVTGLITRAYETGRVICDNQFAESNRIQSMPTGHIVVTNVMFVPLILDGKTAGFISLANKEGDFTDGDMRIAAIFGELTSIALKMHLYDEALKRNEKQLRQALKMEAIGTLAGGIAHEFNNLLYVIYGNIELLLSQARDEDREFLLEINKTAQRAADLVKQILTFCSKAEINFHPIYLNTEIKRIKKMLERLLPRTITIELDITDDLPVIKGDIGQLDQVLINLAINARDALPEGGTIKIKTEESFYKDTLYVLISFSDSGIGIDRDIIDRIYDPFFSTKEIGKGTGLGLSISYGIIKAHNGFILCESEPNKGTMFKIYLPIVEAYNEFVDKLTTKPTISKPNETVLIVDDENSVLIMVQHMLEKMGYRTMIAEDGETALTIYRENKDKINVIILDIGMPGMGGRECLEKLIEFDPEVKIIISSGYAGNGLVRDMLSYGAKNYLLKPYSIDDLSDMLQNVLLSKDCLINSQHDLLDEPFPFYEGYVSLNT